MNKKNFIISKLSLGGLIKAMLGIWKKICLPLAGIYIAGGILLSIVFPAIIKHYNEPTAIILSIFVLIFDLIFYSFFMVFSYKSAVDVCAGRKFLWKNIFKFSRKHLWEYIFVGFGFSILISVAFLLLIIPGIIVGLCALLIFPIMIEENKNLSNTAVDFWNRSKKLVKGIKLRLLGYLIVIGGVCLVAVDILNHFIMKFFFLSSLISNKFNVMQLVVLVINSFVIIWFPIFSVAVYFNRIKLEKKSNLDLE